MLEMLHGKAVTATPPLTVQLGQFLDKSPEIIQELAWNFQRSTPKYRVKRATKPGQARNQANANAVGATAAAVQNQPL